jgi:hypothetical protein
MLAATNGREDCLSKTQDYAKLENEEYGLTFAQRNSIKGEVQALNITDS